MTKKIFRAIFCVALAVLIASLVLITGVLYDYFNTIEKKRLKSEWQLAAAAIETSGDLYFSSLGKSDCRITLIDTDGTVILDSQRDASSMENHSDRSEVKEALLNGSGESIRYSSTLTESTVYFAKCLPDGRVLRVSVTHITVPLLIVGIIQPLAVVVITALIISFVIAKRVSKKIVEPINSLDIDHPLENNVYDEISPLLLHIEKQQKKIKSQESELTIRKKEFYAVIENMREGLVLLNGKDMVLSINPAAMAFFEENECEGKYFYEIERDIRINDAVAAAKQKGSSRLETERRGRQYGINVSSIGSHSENGGTVILIFDITDRVSAERNRREFTANVSHELKTPLHSIMGSAELIENGFVKESDLPEFVGRIRRESARLVTLIDDIIRLSQLDEQTEVQTEDVDFYSVVLEQIQALKSVADEKNVSLKLCGEPVTVKGVRSLLSEIVYNLCDNAVKYNVDGGSVTVSLKKDGNFALLSVKDTGIGIPKECQDRVFERFYRVDKSHSRETGGTGLGLSIVKHAVSYMGGVISLDSEPGRGSEITVKFPSVT